MARQDEIKQHMNEIREHFEKNLNNKYVKNILLKLDIPTDVKHNMNIILDYKTLYFDSRGTLDDMYSSLKAITFFIKEIRARVIPNINTYSGTSFFSSTSNKDPNDRILYQMAVKNYPMNIKILARLIYDLLNMVIDYDSTNFHANPAYNQVKNLNETAIYLKEIATEDLSKKK